MKYERPTIEVVEADFVLLSMSEMGPGATDIGAPTVDAKESVWDEEEILYNNNTNKEEQNHEDWI